ncbi:MAG: lipopolysaccharide biosynthesis protein, partial [Chloroflexi bacterium]|nr:lipopolysaccharide biosynthesis protein [Chloroflexota bacterium]
MSDQQGIGVKAKKGVGWVFVERLLIRGVVFIRIPALAYLLAPDDFGLMALITPILVFLDVITRTGFSAALIQKKDDVSGYWDVVWSMNLVKGVIQTGLILLLIQPITAFYDEPILSSMLLVIAGATFIKNTTSIRMAALVRAINIRKIALYNVTTDALGTVVTISLAYYYRNVWGLVYGKLITIMIKTAGSYIIAPYKPRFDFNRDKMTDLWSFSKWILVSGIFLTLFRNGDDLFVGKVLGVTAVGYYAMAYKMGNMVTTELVTSIRKVLYPTFSLLQDDIPRLRISFLISYSMTAALGFLFSLGLFLLAPQFVSILLPDKWLPIIPPLRVLAVWGGLQMLSTSVAPLVKATGRPDRWAKLQM